VCYIYIYIYSTCCPELLPELLEKLGQEFDSVEGGPHQPLHAGPGTDDSIMYVVYHPSQCLPEYIVTYTEDEL
jgi:hypothetical protein